MIARFGEFELDQDRFELRRDGEPVLVEPQVFDVIVHLLRNRDRLVTKEELLDEVWGTRFVTESTLTTRIKSARRVVDDDGQRQAVIRTVHGRGYLFVADVVEIDETPPRDETSSTLMDQHQDIHFCPRLRRRVSRLRGPRRRDRAHEGRQLADSPRSRLEQSGVEPLAEIARTSPSRRPLRRAR